MTAKDQALIIEQMGGIDDDLLVTLLTLAAAGQMTPRVEERLRAAGIEPDPCVVRERITAARETPEARFAITSLYACDCGHGSIESHEFDVALAGLKRAFWQDVERVAGALRRLTRPRRKPTT